MALIEEYKQQEAELKKAMKPVALFSFLSSLCMLGMPIFLFQVYDRVLMSRNIDTLIALFLIVLVILAGYYVFDSVRQGLLAKAASKMENHMVGLVLAGELARQRDTSAQTIRDLGTIRQIVSSPVVSSLFEAPMAPLFFLLIFFVHPILGGVVLLGGAALIGIAIRGSRRTDPITQEHLESMVAAHRNLETHMNSQEIIRAQGMYREVVQDWGQLQGKQANLFMENFLLTTGYSAASKTARQIVQICMVGAGAILVLSDMATAGVIFATAMIGSRALQPIEQIVGGWRSLKQLVATRQRLMRRLEDLDLPEDRTPLPKPKGELSLDRVVYVPRPGASPIIKGVSGTIRGGDSVAIIGPSGAGKSTLARLLVGYLQPSSGRIMLDGQELHAWDPVARGLHVGYVPQQVNFFDATIRENIARLRRNDPPEMAIAAAKTAGVHELIMSMPQGYDTKISKQEFYPSGGQAQLIALARAFYGDPSVLVLDEPNSALDGQGEGIFHKALDTARGRGMTVIVVTQRRTVLGHVEKVMMMQDGLVKQFGTKEEVLNSGVVQAVPEQPKKTTGKKVSMGSVIDRARKGTPTGDTAQEDDADTKSSAVKGAAVTGVKKKGA